MKPFNLICLFALVLFVSCQNETATSKSVIDLKDNKTDTVAQVLPIEPPTKGTPDLNINDTLNELANFISGNLNYEYKYFKTFVKQKSVSEFASHFEKRWRTFDSLKLSPIKDFVTNEFSKENTTTKLFYPFSGPDFLFSSSLFPMANEITMIGLEPVGTLPIIDDKSIEADSIQNYFNKINSSLNAILKFSFFRTISMKEDLRNDEVDGTIHLILLFLNKTNHQILSIKPFYIDTLGAKQYVKNTLILKSKRYKNSSIEIIALDENKTPKTITYTSTDLSDAALRRNKGLITYLTNLHFETTYLKGASYLMHLKPFSEIRNVILSNTKSIVQDDSGIALSYIFKDAHPWDFKLYGEYTKPINMFTKHYQPELDSLYKKIGAKKLGFGLGYNYRDKNSNFMIINKK